MSDDTPKPPCGVCKGSYNEHFENGKPITQHTYSPNGELVSQAEAAKKQQGQRVPFNPAMLAGSSPQVGRLVEVMMDLNLIGVEQALYVAGMGPKPSSPSGYMDPAVKS